MEFCNDLYSNINAVALYSDFRHSLVQNTLLGGFGLEYPRYDLHHLRNLSYLSTDHVFLRPHDSQWPLWKSPQLRELYSNIERNSGFHDRSVTDANALGTTAAEAEKDWVKHRFWHGNHVSFPLPCVMAASLTMISICILTLTRVIYSFTYDKSNYTKGTALIAFITGLEPSAGVINACMPFMPGVLKGMRLRDSSVYTTVQSILKKMRLSRTTTTSSALKADDSDQFMELNSPETSLAQTASLRKGYSGPGSQMNTFESGPWDSSKDPSRIHVLKDFSIMREMSHPRHSAS